MQNRNTLHYITCFLLSLPILAWNLINKSTWPWDQAWYAEESIRLWQALRTVNVNWLDAVLNAFHSKAPLIAWIGQFFVPLSEILGIHESLLLSIWLTSLIAIFITYKYSYIASNQSRVISLLSVLIVCSSPLFVGLSHEYLTEIYQVLGIAYVYWLYFSSPTLSRGKIYYHLMFSLVIVFGSKSSTILYCFIPLLGIVHNFFHKRISNQKITPLDLLLITLSTLFSLLLATWYVKNIHEIYSFGVSSSSGMASIYYGKADSFFNKFIYWIYVFQKAIITKYVIYIGLMACIILIFIKPFKKVDHSRLKLAILVSLQALIPFIFFSLNINEESRYILPILPSITILIALTASISKIHTKIFLILFIMQYVFVQSFSFGLYKNNESFNHWLKNVDLNPQIRSRNQDLAKHLCHNQNPILYIVGVEYIDFNFNTLGFLGALENTECKFTSLGFAANNVNSAMDRANKLGAMGFVTLKKSCQLEEVDWLNQISKEFVDQIEGSNEFLLSENYDDCILVFRRKN